MKRIVALTLSLLMLTVHLSSCFGRTTAKEDVYTWGDRALGFPKRQHLNALLKSDKNEFDINDVTLDFYYCFYCLDEQTMDSVYRYDPLRGNVVRRFSAVFGSDSACRYRGRVAGRYLYQRVWRRSYPDSG